MVFSIATASPTPDRTTLSAPDSFPHSASHITTNSILLGAIIENMTYDISFVLPSLLNKLILKIFLNSKAKPRQ